MIRKLTEKVMIVSYSMSAMVESVITDKEYRKRGLASACIKTVWEDLIRQKKTPYLNGR